MNKQLLKLLLVVMLQVGAIVLLIVFPAILFGLWLDNIFNTTPFLTLFMVVISVPLTVFAQVTLLKRTIGKMNSSQDELPEEEQGEANYGAKNED